MQEGKICTVCQQCDGLVVRKDSFGGNAIDIMHSLSPFMKKSTHRNHNNNNDDIIQQTACLFVPYVQRPV